MCLKYFKFLLESIPIYFLKPRKNKKENTSCCVLQQVWKPILAYYKTCIASLHTPRTRAVWPQLRTGRYSTVQNKGIFFRLNFLKHFSLHLQCKITKKKLKVTCAWMVKHRILLQKWKFSKRLQGMDYTFLEFVQKKLKNFTSLCIYHVLFVKSYNDY